MTQMQGPDALDLQTIRGALVARQQDAKQAAEILEAASAGIQGLDTVFVAADALLPSYVDARHPVGSADTVRPKKDNARKPSLSASAALSAKEPLLPSTLSRVLRQQGETALLNSIPRLSDVAAWLLREAGRVKESDEIYKQVQLLQSSGEAKVSRAAHDSSLSKGLIEDRPRSCIRMEGSRSTMPSTCSRRIFS